AKRAYDPSQRVVALDPELFPGRLGRNEKGELARQTGGRRYDRRRDRRLLSLRLLPLRGGHRVVLADRQALPCSGGAGMTTTNATGGTVSPQTPGRAKNWYIVHTYSGFEERVRQNLKQRVEAMGMADAFGDVRIPTETLVEMKGGK